LQTLKFRFRSVILLLSVMFFIAVIFYAVVTPRHHENATIFYVKNVDGSLILALHPVGGKINDLVVSIVNNEGKLMVYQLKISAITSVSTDPLYNGVISVDTGKTVDRVIKIPSLPNNISDIELYLYIDQDIDSYRMLSLPVEASSP
jgi:uncharacterized membrane protein